MLAWTLENLVDNAVKFGPEHDVVTISASVCEDTTLLPHLRANSAVGQSPAADAPAEQRAELVVSVKDRGPGVHVDDKDQIFRKFYRARGSKGYKGSGLGLYFCRLAVEAHGGRIWVEDNGDGPGSTFRFTLPV
jgi:signal transduction histidine kinase